MRPSRLFCAVRLVVITLCACACGATPTAPSTPPVTLTQFSVTPVTVNAGAGSEGTVTLIAQAPASGIEIRSSSDGVAVVPASVMVPAGAISATFSITTRLVAADTNATISVMLGSVKREAVLRVIAPMPRPPTLQTLDIDPSVLKGGQNTQGTIRLTGPALGPMRFTPRSSNALATPPPTVTVLTEASSATFTVTTRPVSLDTVFDITVNLADQSRSAQIRLTP